MHITVFPAASFTIAKVWQQPKCLMDKLLKKMCVCVCTKLYIMYSAIKKKKILTFAATWMNFENVK